MAMADEIVLMNEGKIMQKAAPEVIYHDPENIFTAQFIGTPPANVLPAKDGDGFIGYRPEHVKIAGDARTYQGEEAGEEIYRRDGEIVTREMLGSEVLYKIRIPEGDVMVKSLCFSHKAGDQVSISVGQRNLYLFDRNGERIRDEKQLLGKGL